VGGRKGAEEIPPRKRRHFRIATFLSAALRNHLAALVVIKNGRFAGNNVHLVPDQFGTIAEILIETHLPLSPSA